MENAPAFSFIGLSTRVEIYAPPGQRHKVPATCRGGGHRPPRYILTYLEKTYNRTAKIFGIFRFWSLPETQMWLSPILSTVNCLRKLGGHALYPHGWSEGLYGVCGKKEKLPASAGAELLKSIIIHISENMQEVITVISLVALCIAVLAAKNAIKKERGKKHGGK